MGACFKTASHPAGAAAWSSAARRGYRGGGGGGGGGLNYDADAAAYIAATGELFPEALNALVLGIKAAGLWDEHVGSIKKAIGVPSLAASMVDLRNPAFAGTPLNAPGHSATAGWSFLAASEQSIDSGWKCGAAGSKATQDSVHVGLRIMAASAGHPGSVDPFSASSRLGFEAFASGIQRWFANDGATLQTAENPATPAHYIGVRTGATARASYKDGHSLASDTQASQAPADVVLRIGARHRAGGITDAFMTGRIHLYHAGAGLTAAQSATLTALFNAYCAATTPADGFNALASSPVIGVGMKRLHSAYAGPLVRLVRSVDDAEMDFGVDQFGNLDFLAIATWAGGSALLGKRWYNQFGGDDYVQTVKASMPRFSPAGLNGAACFVFDGTDDYMLASLSTAITGAEVLAAFLGQMISHVDFAGWVGGYQDGQPTDNANGAFVLSNGGSAGRLQIDVDGSSAFSTTMPVRYPAAGTGRKDGDIFYVAINGDSEASQSVVENFSSDRSLIGARWYGSTLGFYLHGEIADVSIFNANPGPSDRATLVSYLKAIGGIS